MSAGGKKNTTTCATNGDAKCFYVQQIYILMVYPALCWQNINFKNDRGRTGDLGKS